MGRFRQVHALKFVIYAHDAYLAMVSPYPHLLAAILSTSFWWRQVGRIADGIICRWFRLHPWLVACQWRESIFGNQRNVIEKTYSDRS